MAGSGGHAPVPVGRCPAVAQGKLEHMPLLLTVIPILAAAKKTTSSSSSFILIILVLFVAVYFLFLRPRQQQARKQRENLSAVDVGDEVVTVGGVIGTIVDADGDRLTLRSGGPVESEFGADPTYFVVLRAAVQRKVSPADGGAAADDVVGADDVDASDHDDELGYHEDGLGYHEDDLDEDGPGDSDEDGPGDHLDEHAAGVQDADGAGHNGVSTNGKDPHAVDGGGSAPSAEEGRGG